MKVSQALSHCVLRATGTLPTLKLGARVYALCASLTRTCAPSCVSATVSSCCRHAAVHPALSRGDGGDGARSPRPCTPAASPPMTPEVMEQQTRLQEARRVFKDCADRLSPHPRKAAGLAMQPSDHVVTRSLDGFGEEDAEGRVRCSTPSRRRSKRWRQTAAEEAAEWAAGGCAPAKAGTVLRWRLPLADVKFF